MHGFGFGINLVAETKSFFLKKKKQPYVYVVLDLIMEKPYHPRANDDGLYKLMLNPPPPMTYELKS